MVRSFTLVLIAALTLLSAPEGLAGGKPRGDGRRCTKDAQCLSGYCCNGRCSTEAACCNPFAGDVPCDVDSCCHTFQGEACCYQEPYGFRCADTKSENNNCGACGNQCLNGQICRNGTCGCSDGLTLCNGYCVDTDTDPDNCGTCGHVCAANEECTGGSCVPTCPTDFALCPTDYGHTCCPPFSPTQPGCCRPQDQWGTWGYCCGGFVS
jgi:hypothetical protein